MIQLISIVIVISSLCYTHRLLSSEPSGGSLSRQRRNIDFCVCHNVRENPNCQIFEFLKGSYGLNAFEFIFISLKCKQ